MSPFNFIRLKARLHQAPKTPSVIERDCDEDSAITQLGDEKDVGRLGRWTITRSAMLVVEIAMSMLPILFIGNSNLCSDDLTKAVGEPLLMTALVIASLVAFLNGKKTSSMGSTVERIIQYLPTIFPILFAAIMGKFFKTLALYRAERGILLGVCLQHYHLITSCPFLINQCTELGTACRLSIVVRRDRKTDCAKTYRFTGTGNNRYVDNVTCRRPIRVALDEQITRACYIQPNPSLLANRGVSNKLADW